ncbi:LysR family substrate-binding domain-containing protein [Oerskovia paurometabola]|uniref:LysR family substrate-binding domain-containing protein n=1 Tax=Oerskovia paurometabola TaxID=162170 RepID=A0ABW1X3X4_9CELL|nr:LysR family substrate-binding domain-containing protein [Oerskovia paurometabola]MBM7498433.1 DNA-binding transcriptional LysR family regulator [Oerskovia paurometabola]
MEETARSAEHDADRPAEDVTDAQTPGFRLAYVPGVTPSKWVRTWIDRVPDVRLEALAVPASQVEALLHDGGADVAILRRPVRSEGLSHIAMYTEVPVVVVPRDHVFAALESDEALTVADLADEVVLHPLDDVLGWADPAAGSAADDEAAPVLPGKPALERPATTADAIELVAAGIGLLVVPQSLARLHHRKDLTYRTLDGGPEAPVALGWVTEEKSDLVEEFIGIVRGRTANSSRGVAGPTPPAPEASRKADGRSPSGATSGGKAGQATKGTRTASAARSGAKQAPKGGKKSGKSVAKRLGKSQSMKGRKKGR